MQSKEPIVAFVSLNYPHDGKKMIIIPTWWEKSGKIPAWREKILTKDLSCMTGRRCDDSCVLISTAQFMCRSYKALNESKENKVTNEPKDKNVMQV